MCQQGLHSKTDWSVRLFRQDRRQGFRHMLYFACVPFNFVHIAGIQADLESVISFKESVSLSEALTMDIGLPTTELVLQCD